MIDNVAGRAPNVSVLVSVPQSIRRKVMFVALLLVGVVWWWHWITTLLTLAVSNEQYSHAFLVLPVSLSLALLEGRAKNVKPAWSPFPGLVIILISLAALLALQFTGSVGERALVISIASLVVYWIGLVTLFFGVSVVRQFLFPLIFLFVIVPVPQVLVDKCIVALQVGSTEATFTLFRWSGVPVLKSGFVLTFSTLDIEVAKQCSGIRSSIILLISSLVLAHLYLRSYWGKILLVLAVVLVDARHEGQPRIPLRSPSSQWRRCLLPISAGRLGCCHQSCEQVRKVDRAAILNAALGVATFLFEELIVSFRASHFIFRNSS